MSIAPKALWPATLIPSSATQLYVSPSNTKSIVKRAVFTNTDTSARLLTVYRVPGGGSAATANAVIYQRSLSAGETYTAPELANMVLEATESVYATCDVASKIVTAGSGFTF